MFTIIADFEACQRMRPQIEPGDILKVETGEPITEKDILVISIDKKPLIGSVKLISCGAWVLFSNPAYAAEFVPAEELNRLRIMGRIAERIRKYEN